MKTRLLKSLACITLLALLLTPAAYAQITEIIDATGDGTNTLDFARSVAVDETAV